MKLYVGNLSFNTSNQDLIETFTAVGPVTTANIIEDHETGRSRGFAFIEMETAADGKSAIEQFNGKEIDGRTIKVNEATPKPNGGGGNRDRNGSGRANYGGGSGGQGYGGKSY